MTVLERPAELKTSADSPDEELLSPIQRESFSAFVQRTFREMMCVKFALASFIVNNLRRRYRRSVLGFAWSLLNPLLTMMVMTVVFSLLFKSQPRAFATYLFTGLLPWMFISDAVTNGSQSIVTSEAFLKKVYIPKIFFPLVAVGTEAVNFSLSLVSMIFLGICMGLHVTPALLLAPLAILLLTAFNFGMAQILAVATVYFRDVTHIIKIVLNAAFYLVPIIYPLSQIPEKFRIFFLLNPVYYFIDLFRLTINEGQMPTLAQWSIPAVTVVATMAVAMLMLKRTERDLIYRL